MAVWTLVHTKQLDQDPPFHFQTNSSEVWLEFERNTDLRHVNEPKTGRNVTGCDPKKDRKLKHTWFFSCAMSPLTVQYSHGRKFNQLWGQ